VLGPSQVHLDRLLDGDQGLAAIEDLVLQLDDGQCAPVDIIKETFFLLFQLLKYIESRTKTKS
jgi:hypothetical protein